MRVLNAEQMRQVDEAGEGIGRDREIHPVVFPGPDRAHSAVVRHATQAKELFVKLRVRHIISGALHMCKK